MKLGGIFVACVTPWKHGNEVDEAALWRHLEMLLAAGVHGLCAAGSTGEFPRLSREEYGRLVQATVEIAAGRVPVVAGIGHASIEGSVELARLAAKAGADAAVAPPPFYFPYGQPEIASFFEHLAGKVDLPLLLYNIPQYSSVIEPATAANLLRRGPFAGIKDSGGSLETLEAVLAARRERPFSVLCGFDRHLGRALEMGADGGLSGVAACAPEALVALHNAARTGRHDMVERAQAVLDECIARLDAFPAPIGIRIALEARGIPVGPHAVPLAKETVAEAKRFALWFEGWLEQVQAASASAQA